MLRLTLWLAAAPLFAQSPDAVRRWTDAHQQAILREFVDLLSIPNIAADRENIRRNASFIRDMLVKRGLRSEILETAGNPLVWGEKVKPGAARTVLFYIHYDGQPVNPAQWKQPSPFTPVLRDGSKPIPDFLSLSSYRDDWRLYARSASDDKAPIVALCAALDALGGDAAVNVRVVIDGEEEAGSPSLSAAVDRYRDKLRADVLVVLDGPVHASGRPTLVFGARGNATLDLIAIGPRNALHSGHYGNWIPNPAVRLARLLASMKDERGRTTIEGWYEGVPPLTDEERRTLRDVGDDEPGLLRLFGVVQADAVAPTLQEAIQFPSLNVRGLRSGYIGADARTIIPPEATAAIDIRLVKETPGAAQVQKVLDHIRRQGWQIVEREPSDDERARHPKLLLVRRGGITEAFRTEMNHPEALRITRTIGKVLGAPPVRIRTMGGTVPISTFVRALDVPAVSLPIVNFDNNQHGENENLRLGHLWKGIAAIAGVMAAP